MAAALILGEHRVAARHHILAERHVEAACTLARRAAGRVWVCNAPCLVVCDPSALLARMLWTGRGSLGQASMAVQHWCPVLRAGPSRCARLID